MAALSLSTSLLAAAPGLVPSQPSLLRSSIKAPASPAQSPALTQRTSSSRARAGTVVAMAEVTEKPKITEKLGVYINHAPTPEELEKLNYKSWTVWDKEPSEFKWTFNGKETAYVIDGAVKIIPDGQTDFVEFGAGDLITFPDGMTCTWIISKAVHKYYMIHPSA